MPSFSTGAAGVPASRKFPSVYTQVKLGASPNTAGGALRKVLILANKTASGTATLDTQINGPLTPDTAITLGGQGSEYHLGVTAGTILEPGASLFAIAVTQSAGVAASQTLTVGGVAATGDGNLAILIHGVLVNVSILSGQSLATQGANIAAAINGKGAFLCVTAAAVGPVVTLTFRHNGTRGNLVALHVTPDTSITGSTYTLGGATLSGGTLTDDITAAMSTASARKFDYYALFQVDTTNLTTFQTKILANAGPLVRKRSQGISCNLDTQGNATTQATTLNEPRLQILWHKNGEHLPGVAASGWAARRSVRESDSPNFHWSLLNPDAVDLSPIIPPPFSEAGYVLESEANSALDSGLTPIFIRQVDKHPQITLSITSHSQDSFGAPDTRTLTTNMVTVPDHWADFVETYVPTAFPGMFLRDDPVEGDDPLPPNTITPLVLKGHLIDQYKRFFDLLGQIKNFDSDTAQWAFNLDAFNANRIDASMPVTPAPWLTQFSSQILQQSG